MVSIIKHSAYRTMVSQRLWRENHRAHIRFSLLINSVILRISYVYVTYILRIWYVIESGKTGFSKEKKLGCIMVVWWLYCTVHLEEFCYQK